EVKSREVKSPEGKSPKVESPRIWSNKSTNAPKECGAHLMVKTPLAVASGIESADKQNVRITLSERQVIDSTVGRRLPLRPRQHLVLR
ncbi:hypothetical protein OU790_18585, partial [Ruegeria sp. NA]